MINSTTLETLLTIVTFFGTIQLIYNIFILHEIKGIRKDNERYRQDSRGY